MSPANANATEVREMFTRIAPAYDRTNTLLSAGLHHLWRRRAVKAAQVVRGQRVLDCATGTGDLALAFQRRVGADTPVTGLDFCAAMLDVARRKALKADSPAQFVQGDATALDFADNSFDAASIAFGIRNVEDPLLCLQEMARVVRPGGHVVVLEFGQPTAPGFSWLYRLYSRFVMPWIGFLSTGNRQAYEYLPETAAAFPMGDQFLALMRETGMYAECHATPLTFGIAYIYTGRVA